MKILIIAVNRSQNPFSVMPLGACLIAEDAERAGHAVSLLDLMYERDPLGAVEAELKKIAPDIIGLSVRNIDNNDMQEPRAFFEDLPPLIDVIRKNSKAGIVLGGAAVGVMPEELLRYTGLSYGVTGNGEGVFVKLIETLSRGGCPSGIPGVAWIDNGIFKSNHPSLSSAGTDCHIPDFNRWLDTKAYLSRLSTVPIQSKRGCPFECVYCTYAVNEGRDYRLCPPEKVVEEVERLVSTGLRDIEFVDNVFNSPYDHAMDICRGLAKARLGPRFGARFQSLELNPAFLDDPLLTAMEEAGFSGIGITAESASDSVLKGLKKGFSLNQIRLAAEVVGTHRVPCIWIFMFGGPGETEDTVRETLAFAEECVRPKDVAFFNVGIRVYPGTEIEEIARREGTLAVSRGDMLAPVFYLSPKLKIEWLSGTLNKVMAEHPNFLTSNSIGLSFLPTIYRLGYGLGIRQPLWRHTRVIRRGLRSLGLNV